MHDRQEGKDKEIRGYRVDAQFICPLSCDEEEPEEVTKGNVLTGDMRKTYGVILAVIGYMILFWHTEGWGADWKLYSQTPEALYYFDVRSVNPSRENTISVEVKLNFTDKGVIEMVQQFGKDYQDISYELNHYEINCADKKFRVSSVTRYSRNGTILLRVSRDESEWIPIPHDSTSESLCKMVCK